MDTQSPKITTHAIKLFPQQYNEVFALSLKYKPHIGDKEFLPPSGLIPYEKD